MTCPQCSSSSIRPSSHSSWKDILPRLRGREAFRCRKCRHRFFALPSTQIPVNNPDQPSRKIKHDKLSKQRQRRRLFRRIVTVVVVVVTFSLFGLFLHYITADHPSKPTEDEMSVSGG